MINSQDKDLIQETNEEPNKGTRFMIDQPVGSLAGKILIASPSMPDERFSKSVIYVCAHNEKGAMGLVINRAYGSMDLTSLLHQLNISNNEVENNPPVFCGGPIDSARGFVLHSSEVHYEGTLVINEHISMTATIDILRALSENKGPDKILLALGHTSWNSGQLDKEVVENGWFVANPTSDLIFDQEFDTKWQRAFRILGAFNVAMISSAYGKA